MNQQPSQLNQQSTAEQPQQHNPLNPSVLEQHISLPQSTLNGVYDDSTFSLEQNDTFKLKMEDSRMDSEQAKLNDSFSDSDGSLDNHVDSGNRYSALTSNTSEQEALLKNQAARSRSPTSSPAFLARSSAQRSRASHQLITSNINGVSYLIMSTWRRNKARHCRKHS